MNVRSKSYYSPQTLLKASKSFEFFLSLFFTTIQKPPSLKTISYRFFFSTTISLQTVHFREYYISCITYNWDPLRPKKLFNQTPKMFYSSELHCLATGCTDRDRQRRREQRGIKRKVVTVSKIGSKSALLITSQTRGEG